MHIRNEFACPHHQQHQSHQHSCVSLSLCHCLESGSFCSDLPVLIHMSTIVMVYVMSGGVRPASRLAFLPGKNFNIGHYMPIFQPNFFIPAILTSAINFYHFIPLSLSLFKVSTRQNFLASYSPTKFDLLPLSCTFLYQCGLPWPSFKVTVVWEIRKFGVHRAWNSLWKRGFSRKWKAKIAKKIYFQREKYQQAYLYEN